jgi:hypothetical protein
MHSDLIDDYPIAGQDGNKMSYPRISAALFVLILIGSLAFAMIAGVEWVDATITHVQNLKHKDGTIIAIGPGMDFVLKTSNGQNIHFQCGDRCRTSLGHIQRHILEHAHTDIYYIQGANNVLTALDVD